MWGAGHRSLLGTVESNCKIRNCWESWEQFREPGEDDETLSSLLPYLTYGHVTNLARVPFRVRFTRVPYYFGI